jgi:hypothetical protein
MSDPLLMFMWLAGVVMPVTVSLWLIATSHAVRHRWTTWQDAEVVVAYGDDGLPISREQIQERRCKTCNRLEARRVAL